MDKKKSLEMIASLSNANGISGFEDSVLTELKKYSQSLGHVSQDRMKNFYINLKDEKDRKKLPVLQLDAHSDEVGFMVQAICPNGTLKFIPIGGWVSSNVPAHRVRVLNGDGKYITGVVASKPPHFMSEAEKKQAVDIPMMVIDLGASSYEEVVNDYKIRIGAPVVPDALFEYHEEKDLMLGKAFDCRLGCACIIDVLNELKEEKLDVHVTGAISVQEEVGMRGAQISAQRVEPDIAIVFEGCPADDTFAEGYMIQTAMKKGPMLRHIDAGMITNPKYQRYALDLGQKLGIPVQEAVRTGGATNGKSIHLNKMGVPVIVVGLPVRYIHTHYGFASFSDYENAVKLTTELIKTLNEEIINCF